MKLEVDVRLTRGAFTLQVTESLDLGAAGLFGPSGAGKTTLLHAVAGLVRPTSGTIRLDGRTLFSSNDRVFLPAHRRRVGVVFQDARLFPHYGVRGNLEYGAHGRADGAGAPRLDDVVELLELGVLLERRAGELSGGERQRVAIARALLGAPRLLCLDEPLASMDLDRRRAIIPFLCRVRDELHVPMLGVTHTMTELLQLTDRVVLLERGRVSASGTYRDLAMTGVVRPADVVNVLGAELVESSDGGVRIRVGGAGGPLVLALPRLARAGSISAITIRPTDIAIALAAVRDVSIQNQIPGRVSRIAHRDGEALVEVDVGAPLIASVGENMVKTLAIVPGGEVVCLVKASAIRLA